MLLGGLHKIHSRQGRSGIQWLERIYQCGIICLEHFLVAGGLTLLQYNTAELMFIRIRVIEAKIRSPCKIIKKENHYKSWLRPDTLWLLITHRGHCTEMRPGNPDRGSSRKGYLKIEAINSCSRSRRAIYKYMFSPPDGFNWLDMIKTSLSPSPPSDPAPARRAPSVRCPPPPNRCRIFLLSPCLAPSHWTESCICMKYEGWRWRIIKLREEREVWLTLGGSQNTDLRHIDRKWRISYWLKSESGAALL